MLPMCKPLTVSADGIGAVEWSIRFYGGAVGNTDGECLCTHMFLFVAVILNRTIKNHLEAYSMTNTGSGCGCVGLKRFHDIYIIP